MSDNVKALYGNAEGNDYNEHEATYVRFTSMVKWGTISVIVVVALMAFFLV
ncbi:MAG TPA: aa3-type cytochrome c oxidase subunit IV [Xanthobacteraceae bacterium]|nr:aa3-type cytochrome c oxidase subunit IV [Xanthobacteraceae bacterium]